MLWRIVANFDIGSYPFVMASLNISMPDELRKFVTRRTKETNHATPTEYIRSLVREDRKRAEQEDFDKLLLAGLGSGKSMSVKNLDKYFAQKAQRLMNRRKPKAERR
jgi:antitoxin ParD1/3/4